MEENTKEKKSASANTSEKKTAGKKESEKKETKVRKAPAEKKVEFKGEYIKAIGRRKSAVAQVRMYKEGDGKMIVNGYPAEEYFQDIQAGVAYQPAKLSGLKDIDFSVLVKGGGKSAQAEAVRHGMARVLVKFDEEYKLPMKSKGWLTRDPRRVERKKPGLKKARRSPQWSKR